MKSPLKTITILFRSQSAIESLIKADIKQYGMSVSEFAVLEALYHKQVLTVTELVEKVLIAPSSMSYVLDQMSRKEWILRTQDSQDKRAFQITLLPKGLHQITTIYPMHGANMRKRLDRLTPEEEMQLQELLKRIGK